MWEMQSTTRALVAFAEWVHGTVFEPGSAILTWPVEFSGQVVSKRSVSDGKTAYERRKLKSFRKVPVPFGELVMFMPMEKTKDKGEVRNCVGIMLGLVDRSDEVVIGTAERVVKARTVHRMPAGQRGDAAYAKCIRGVPWQPNPAEAAEGEPLGMIQARIVSVPMVAVENRPAVPVMEPTTLECAKENPRYLGTRIPESESRSDRVSRFGIVSVACRFAVLWIMDLSWVSLVN